MRNLFVLRGAPGTGKSTFIRSHHWHHLSVGLDDVRALFSADFTDLDGDPTFSISPHASRQIFTAYTHAVTTRLAQGATVFLDCTHPDFASFKDAAQRAEHYGYRVHVLDFQGDFTNEELIARDARRKGTRDYVGADAVGQIAEHNRNAAQGIPYPIIDATDSHAAAEYVRAQGFLATEDLTHTVDRIVIIGDVHSCATALTSALSHFGGLDAPRTRYIFLGDLFDRGPDAPGVFDAVGRGQHPQVTLVEGNHDTTLRLVTARLASHAQSSESLAQLRAAEVSDADLHEFFHAFVPLFSFTFHGEEFLATHGGLAPSRISALRVPGGFNLTDAPLQEIILGSSRREEVYRGTSTYAHVDHLLATPGLTQLHGHRNGGRSGPPQPETATPGVINLEQGVEVGGHLAVALLEYRDGKVVQSVHRFTEPARAPQGVPADGDTRESPGEK